MRFLAAQGKFHNFLRLHAVRFSTSCGFLPLDFQLLAFPVFLRVCKPQKQDIFTSCSSLRVLTAQERLAPLLARVLFLAVL